MAALMAGLQPGDLSKSLNKKPVRSYEDLMSKAHAYMNMEEAEAYKAAETRTGKPTTSVTHQAPKPASQATTSTPTALPAKPSQPLPRREEPESTPREPPRSDRNGRFDRRDHRRAEAVPPILAVLNTSLSGALDKAQRDGFLNRPPPPMKADPSKRSTRHYCRYHRDHGHDTSDCRVLQRDMEDLIQRGFLKNLVRRDQPPGKDDRRARSRSPRPRHEPEQGEKNQGSRGVINTISGGPTMAGESNNARKRYAKHALQVNNSEKKLKVEAHISFSEADLAGVETPHDDPIVITADIDGFQVKRIMVDTGSSVDILFLDAFNRMKIDRSRLHPSMGPLIGFTGHSHLPEGIITLPLTVGRSPCRSTVDVQFVVVDIWWTSSRPTM